MRKDYNPGFISEVVRNAWEDDISFEIIKKESGLSEGEVIKIMRSHLKSGSYKLWRKRVSGRSSKHEKKSTLLKQESE